VEALDCLNSTYIEPLRSMFNFAHLVATGFFTRIEASQNAATLIVRREIIDELFSNIVIIKGLNEKFLQGIMH